MNYNKIEHEKRPKVMLQLIVRNLLTEKKKIYRVLCAYEQENISKETQNTYIQTRQVHQYC